MIRYAGQPHGIAGHWNNVHRMLNELAWWNQYLTSKAATGSTTSLNIRGSGDRVIGQSRNRAINYPIADHPIARSPILQSSFAALIRRADALDVIARLAERRDAAVARDDAGPGVVA